MMRQLKFDGRVDSERGSDKFCKQTELKVTKNSSAISLVDLSLHDLKFKDFYW